MRRVLQLWLISRTAYITISVVVLFLPALRSPVQQHAATIIGMWFRYDANHYVQIAQSGYSTAYLGNWPPLYPLLIHLLSWLPGSPLLPALLVTNGLALLGCIGMVCLQGVEDTRSVLCLLAYPLAFFLAAPWAMSLLFCLAVWCFYFINHRVWSLAALCVFLAVLDADIGICLAIPLIWSWGQQRLPEVTKGIASIRQLAVEQSVVLFAAPLALVAWCGFQEQVYGKVASFHDQLVYFGHHLVWPGLGLWLLLGNLWSVALYHRPDLLRLLVDVLPFVGISTIAIYASIRRLWPSSHALYVFALLTMILCLPVSGQQFPDVIVSAGRYLLTAVPIWLVLPRIFTNHRRLGAALLIVSCMLQVVILVYYLRGGWLV